MRKHMKRGMSRTVGWLRGQWPDRNPLRRATDRVETAIVGVLVIAFLALAPVAAVIASHWAAGSRAAAHVTKREVPATLLAGAPDPIRYSGLAHFEVRARWRTPAGTVRTGEVPVTAGSRAGSIVMIWIDRSGELVRSAAEVAGQQVAAGMAAVLGAAAALFFAVGYARRILDRRRMAAWDADWLVTEPRWTRRR